MQSEIYLKWMGKLLRVCLWSGSILLHYGYLRIRLMSEWSDVCVGWHNTSETIDLFHICRNRWCIVIIRLGFKVRYFHVFLAEPKKWLKFHRKLFNGLSFKRFLKIYELSFH